MNSIRLDEQDKKILTLLQENGRLTNKELAERINLTTTPTLERVRRLEREGVIEGYTARINRKAVQKGFTAFVSVTLNVHQLKLLDDFNKEVEAIPEILACYNTTGEGDFLLHIVAGDVEDYERVMRTRLANLPGVQRLHTSIVLSTIKEHSIIPVP